VNTAVLFALIVCAPIASHVGAELLDSAADRLSRRWPLFNRWFPEGDS
jgi:hypothetical protein